MKPSPPDYFHYTDYKIYKRKVRVVLMAVFTLVAVPGAIYARSLRDPAKERVVDAVLALIMLGLFILYIQLRNSARGRIQRD